MSPADRQPAPGFRSLLERTRGVQKSQRGAAAYSRWVNRPFGRILAVAAFRLGMTPNQVTGVSCVFTFGAIALIASVRPSWPVDVVVAISLVLGYAFDSADGQLARLRGGGSVAGEWLDHVADAVKTSTIHLAVLICWFRFYDLPRPALLLIPVGYTVVASAFFFSIILSQLLRRISTAGTAVEVAIPHAEPPAPPAAEAAPVLRSLLVAPMDHGVLSVMLVTLPAPWLFGSLYSAMGAFALLYLLAGWRSWYREMKTL